MLAKGARDLEDSMIVTTDGLTRRQRRTQGFMQIPFIGVIVYR